MIELCGQIFGRLTVVSEAESVKGRRRVLCQCTCGNTKVIRVELLRNGKAKSCGCLRSELVATKNQIHGGAGSPEYQAWANMMQRCYNAENCRYEQYGGRGIRVCNRWHDASLFLADMGPKPSPDHSLERTDNNANYSPQNCIWATAHQQQRNTSRTTKVSFRGALWCLTDLSKESGVSRSTLRRRLAKGMTAEEAIAVK